MDVRGEQVVYGIIEIIATHNLVKYLKGNGPDERVRMAAGATLAGLGFVFGPDIEARLRSSTLAQDAAPYRRELLFTAAGAAAGAMSAYWSQSRAAIARPAVPGPLGRQLDDALAAADPSAEAFDPDRPGGLLTIASAAWLGYSLFFDGKTPAEQHQHLWGLGAGTLGYLYGPEALRWVNGITLPRTAADDTIGLFRSGSIAWSAMLGGGAGWLLAKTLPTNSDTVGGRF